ncbi:hypothetical protein HK105_207602 [Polyrhizophydium stewartii]|uniref:Uncharacterized protein n=1 Tax=Polyrhizophydium stewartii TaxID=2732419 RepID=A0ABR4N0G8_9FUNG|nr:hypothetical protein HK105_002415 [Polyrhizophydium stewartii]
MPLLARAAAHYHSKVNDHLVNYRTIFRDISFKRTRTRTVTHHPRVFAFLALFVIPYAISVATVIMRDVYSASIGPSVEYDSASMDFHFGFFAFAMRMTDPGPDSSATLATYPTDWTVFSYKDMCDGVRFSTKFDPGQLVDPSVFCSRLWMTIQISQVAAVGCGALAILLLLENMLVWSGYSLWFRPSVHKNSHVRIVRKWFKVQINVAVFSHAALQVFASALVVSVHQQRLVRWPRGIQYNLAMWLAIISWGADLLFVLLFFCFDYLTFFHVSASDDGASASAGDATYNEIETGNGANVAAESKQSAVGRSGAAASSPQHPTPPSAMPPQQQPRIPAAPAAEEPPRSAASQAARIETGVVRPPPAARLGQPQAADRAAAAAPPASAPAATKQFPAPMQLPQPTQQPQGPSLLPTLHGKYKRRKSEPPAEWHEMQRQLLQQQRQQLSQKPPRAMKSNPQLKPSSS